MAAQQRPPQEPVSIDALNAWVWHGTRRLDLAPKAFAVLRYLIEQAGRLVTKDELYTAVWGETIVSEAALISYIRDLRKALGDSSRTPRYIETVHKRGFRFVGAVAATPPVQSSRFKVPSQDKVVSSPPPPTQSSALCSALCFGWS
jgi:DNA-binding winged helix-turn-helix (wHTH) protein